MPTSNDAASRLTTLSGISAFPQDVLPLPLTEYREHAHRLFTDYPLRSRMAKACHAHAEGRLCNRDEHIAAWLAAFRA